MSKEKYIFHFINSIRSRPDDNPQSKNGTVFEQIFTESSEGVAIMDSSANSGTKYLNQPWMCYLTSLNLTVAHPSVRWRGYTDLLSKFIGISDYLKTGTVSAFMCSTGFSAYWTMTAFTKCIQLRRILQNTLAQTIQNVWFQVLTTEQNGHLPTTRYISSGSANSTFKSLKWLRKSCSQQLKRAMRDPERKHWLSEEG